MPAGIKIMEREVNFIVQKLSQQPLTIQVFDEHEFNDIRLAAR